MSSVDSISVVFMGTPDFAVPVLEALATDVRFCVQAVFSQPDRAAGRSNALSVPPVKRFALERDIPVYQPEDGSGIIPVLEKLRPDFSVTVAYGLILPREVLELPRFGSVNVHYSLLPKYRGASPVAAALLNGDSISGVTVMKMSERLDAGDILAQKEVSIGDNETAEDLLQRFSLAAGGLLLDTLVDYSHIVPRPQDERLATYCKKLRRDDGRLDFTRKTAQELYNQYRALYPWPGIFSELSGKRLKVLDLEYERQSHLAAGQWEFSDREIRVGAREGLLKLNRVQLEGKSPMDAPAFIRGLRLA